MKSQVREGLQTVYGLGLPVISRSGKMGTTFSMHLVDVFRLSKSILKPGLIEQLIRRSVLAFLAGLYHYQCESVILWRSSTHDDCLLEAASPPVSCEI